MTHGGELAITLIDARYHWELEVVDNVERFPKSQDELNVMFSEPLREDTMPGVLPLSANRHLKRAYQAAISHGGQLQTWNCPEGGTAHVLVIPKRRNMTCQSRVA